MKKYLITFLILITLCGIRFYNPWFLDVMRLKALDNHQRQQETVIVDNIVTVEINNDTLAEYGQWPFPRSELAEIVYDLQRNGAGLIVMPMLLSEPDRAGPEEDIKFELIS